MSIPARLKTTNSAETVGFEPTEGFNTLTVLAGPRTRPDYATSPSTCCTATNDTGQGRSRETTGRHGATGRRGAIRPPAALGG